MRVIELSKYRRFKALLDELAEQIRKPDEGARFYEHLTKTGRDEMKQKVTYTIQEAAQILSVHPQTVRAWIHSGELQAAKIGQTYRLDRGALQALWTAKGGGRLFTSDGDTDAEIFDEGADDE